MTSTADHYERLAEIVAAAESDGTDVIDTTTDVFSGKLRATIEVTIDEGRVSTPAHSLESRALKDGEEYHWSIAPGGGLSEDIEGGLEDADVDAEEIVDELEGDDSEQPADAEATPETAEQEDVGVPRESDVAPADLEGDEDDQDDEPDVWCGVCGAGPFEMLSIHAGRVHDGDEIALDHEPVATELTDPPAELLPDYDGPDPESVVAESGLPARVVLPDVLDAAVDATRADAPVVSCVTDELGVSSDAIVPVLRELGLQEADSRMLVDDVGERVAAIRQEVEA